jgi:hypothetical protein
VGAYVGCGLCSNFVDDDWEIMTTPDVQDVLGADGREQITAGLKSCAQRWDNPWWWAFGK